MGVARGAPGANPPSFRGRAAEPGIQSANDANLVAPPPPPSAVPLPRSTGEDQARPRGRHILPCEAGGPKDGRDKRLAPKDHAKRGGGGACQHETMG